LGLRKKRKPTPSRSRAPTTIARVRGFFKRFYFSMSSGAFAWRRSHRLISRMVSMSMR
jgi:hypothetical protein